MRDHSKPCCCGRKKQLHIPLAGLISLNRLFLSVTPGSFTTITLPKLIKVMNSLIMSPIWEKWQPLAAFWDWDCPWFQGLNSVCCSQASFHSYINSVLLKLPIWTCCVNGGDDGSKALTEKVPVVLWFCLLCSCLWLCRAFLSIVWGGQDLSPLGAGTCFPVGAQPHAQLCPNCHPMCQPQDAPVPGCSPCGSGHRGYGLPFLCASHYPPLRSGHKGKTAIEKRNLYTVFLSWIQRF